MPQKGLKSILCQHSMCNMPVISRQEDEHVQDPGVGKKRKEGEVEGYGKGGQGRGGGRGREGRGKRKGRQASWHI